MDFLENFLKSTSSMTIRAPDIYRVSPHIINVCEHVQTHINSWVASELPGRSNEERTALYRACAEPAILSGRSPSRNGGFHRPRRAALPKKSSLRSSASERESEHKGKLSALP